MPDTKAKILCADGHRDTRELLALVMKMDGYAASMAESEAEALALLRADNFDLIITEQQLPDGTGVDLHQQLQITGKQIPILFFTTETRPHERKLLEERGACLTKPAPLHSLRQAIYNSLHGP